MILNIEYYIIWTQQEKAAIEESNKDSHQLTYTLLQEATIEPSYLRMNDIVV
jgi:hypothetical protein